MHGLSKAIIIVLLKNAVLPEWKPPVYDNTHGITLVTATTRRNSPNVRFFFSLFSPSPSGYYVEKVKNLFPMSYQDGSSWALLWACIKADNYWKL
jgi:hypothetical protein